MSEKDKDKKQAALQAARPVPLQTWVDERYYPEIADYKDDATAKAIRRRQVIRHRAIWSFSLLGLVVVLNIFSMTTVILIGMHKLNYANGWSVPAVIVANFAETWTLTKIAMKFWFNHASDE